MRRPSSIVPEQILGDDRAKAAAVGPPIANAGRNSNGNAGVLGQISKGRHDGSNHE